jgi:hypothetical protein
MLAHADAATRVLCLPEGQPRLRRKARLDNCAPQDQDIDARIAARGQRVARQTGSGATGRSPRLGPRQAPGLQLEHDLGGDLVVKADPVLDLTILARGPAAGTAADGFTHGFLHTTPKKHKASPRRRGRAADSDQEARLQRPAAPSGRNEGEHPKRSAGVAAGRDGPSRERRPHPPPGRGHKQRRRAPEARRPWQAQCDRHRRPRPAMGSAARQSCWRRRARSRLRREAPTVLVPSTAKLGEDGWPAPDASHGVIQS